MEFRRINSSTIRCILTEEDMNEYDMTIEDFFHNSPDLHEFLKEIMDRAGEEVGYIPSDLSTVSMQIMPLTNNRLAVTITENTGNAISSILENIKSTIAEIASGALDGRVPGTLAGNGENIDEEQQSGDIEEEIKEEIKETIKEEVSYKSSEKRRDNVGIRVVRFENMEALSGFINAVELRPNITSSLYYEEGKKSYIMVIKSRKGTADDFERVVIKVSDYGSIISDSKQCVESVKEYARCIMKTGAIGRLKKCM